MELRLIVVAVFFCSVCGSTKAQMVKPLNTSITATSCGKSKLCMRVNGCDPETPDTSCFFSSTQFNDTVLSVEISGTTPGYVALGLTPTTKLTHQLTQGAVVFVCGNNNSMAFFETANKSGMVLTPIDVAALNISTVQASVTNNQSLIQCTFNISLNSTILSLIQTSRVGTVQLPFNVTILKGDINGTELVNATTVFDSNGTLDLANPKSNIPTPVPNVNLNLTRDGCNKTKLCLSTPSECDPAGRSNCFFTSVRKNKNVFDFALSGTTAGYVALGLTKNNSTVVFICANNSNSGDFFFETARKKNNSLMLKPVSTVHSSKGVVLQDKTQCIFNTSTTFTVKAEETMYRVTIMNGTTNGTQLGAPTVLFDSNVPLDLSDPKGSSHRLIGSLCINVLAMLLSALTLRLL